MKKIIRNNFPLLIGIIIGILSVSGVYAASTMLESNTVSYEKSNGTSTNVQEAIDELYEINRMHNEEWKEEELKGNDPVITGDLIPVVIKPSGDVYYANKNSEWYNYSEKRWANAVILNSGKTYSEGQKIEEEDINGYFVWIPRYKYQVWHINSEDKVIDGSTLTNTNYENSITQALGQARLINIEFESKETSKSTNPTKDGEWLTHPAFTLGSKELSGIWVGKFETGGNESSIVVKPNEISWRNATVKEFFDAGKNYANTLDSHMMKNTEWGAVAYLSHSKYGIGTEVRVNNNSGFVTGYSASANTDQSDYTGDTGKSDEKEKTQPYNTPTGYLASTTGNITGVYDMSGGAHEYMAACMENTPGEKSGFNEEELASEMEKGYIDKYPSNSNMTSYSNRILGDATGEMGPFYDYYDKEDKFYHNVWYADVSLFVDSSAPWFARGGGYIDGVLAGQFHINRNVGVANIVIGFRLVLSPENNS